MAGLRVGVFTHHWVANHGANLQALSTKLAFEKRGCLVEFINFREKARLSRFENNIEPEQRDIHKSFVNEYLNESRLLESQSELRLYVEENYDVVAVGSDAMFQLETIYDPFVLLRVLKKRDMSFLDKELAAFWLPWDKTENGPLRASLSCSSMGTYYKTILGGMRSQLKSAINNFDFLGVRDPWTYDMVKYFGGSNINMYADPVFSLKYNFDFETISLKGDYSKTIFISGPISELWLESFLKVAHASDYQVAGIRTPEYVYKYKNVDFNLIEPIGPLEWYKLLSSSAGYIGIRFHALASCISQGVPVINVDPHLRSRFMKQSSKMYDLCKKAFDGNNFYTTVGLQRSEPGVVLEELLSKQTLQLGGRYESSAKTEFESQIDEIIKMASGL